jgi:hypothetical protein
MGLTQRRKGAKAFLDTEAMDFEVGRVSPLTAEGRAQAAHVCAPCPPNLNMFFAARLENVALPIPKKESFFSHERLKLAKIG